MNFTFSNNIKFALLAAGIALLLTACLGDSNSTSSTIDKNLLETADSFGDLSKFSALVDSSDLQSMLSESGSYTLFTPTDEAFNYIPAKLLDTLSREELTKVLAYHIADTTLFIDSIKESKRLPSLHDESLYLSYINGRAYINGGRFLGANYRATNGVVHAINKVLLPDKYLNVVGLIIKRYSLYLTLSGLAETGLGDTLRSEPQDGFTVFAPHNGPMSQLSVINTEAYRDTLKYHIIPKRMASGDFESSQQLTTLNGQQIKVEYDGKTITVNDSIKVVEADITGTNGVVHVVDKVVIPPSN